MTENERHQIADKFGFDFEKFERSNNVTLRNIENRQAQIANMPYRNHDWKKSEIAGFQDRMEKRQEELNEFLSKIREENGGCDETQAAQ